MVNLCLHLRRERYQPVCLALREPQNTHYEHVLQDAGVPLHFLKGALVQALQTLIDRPMQRQ